MPRMQSDFFYRLGQWTTRYRWIIIAFGVILIGISIPFTSNIMNPFKDVGFIDPNAESARANTVLNESLGYNYNQFILMYHSDELLATDPEFLNQIKKSVSHLSKLPGKHKIIFPDSHNKQISSDRHTAYAVILFAGKKEKSEEFLEQFKSNLKNPPDLVMRIGGEPIFLDDIKKQTQIDLFHAEYIATPVAIITMLIVFGTLVSAALPIVLGAASAFFILMTLFTLGHFFSLSVFTINIALLLGICLSLDYSLLIINRFRDELADGRGVEEAVAVTESTAGKSVFFSGLAVFISLSALLLFKVNILFSVGMGGLAAVLVSAAIALLVLPAVLSILGNRINRFPIPFFKKSYKPNNRYYNLVVAKAVKRPYVYFISILIVLLSLGYPFLHAKFGISNFKILPKNLESRQVFDYFSEKFGESKLSPIVAVIKTSDKNILTKNNIGHLYDFSKKISNDPRIKQVDSIVSVKPPLTKSQYQMIYMQPEESLNPALQDLLELTTHKNLTTITIVSKTPSDSETTAHFIKDLRKKHPGHHLTLEVTGPTANIIDVLSSIAHTFPYALLWILGFTYIILLILLRSVILPLKAILTTILSLFASYGVLVIVIQMGHFHSLLHFEPQHMLDISLLIIIFCALFGISMDYEVFLLTRIKEYYEQTHDTVKSIKLGIDRSWRIITSAAIIVILICFSFMAADILIVKAFGLGIAAAVFVDAYIIRTLLVPATMTILNSWNWYLPKWLDKILPEISFNTEHYSHKKVSKK